MGTITDIYNSRKWQTSFTTDVDLKISGKSGQYFDADLMEKTIGKNGQIVFVRTARKITMSQTGLQIALFLCYGAPGLFELV